MKHRIIALVLALVLIGAMLTGCAYNIERDDLTQYASFDLDAFKQKLLEIEIKDSGDYSVAEGEEADALREQKLLEKIEDALKSAVDTSKDDAKKTEGAFADRQLLSYCYYVTASDGKIYYTSNMKIASPTTLMIGSIKDDKLVKAIGDALKESGIDLKDCVYTTKSGTSDTAEAGKLAFVTYTREYTLNDEVKKTTMTLCPVLLPAEADETFAGKLIGQKLATSLSDTFTVTETVGEGEDAQSVEVTYSGVKIDFVSESTAAVDVPYTYDEKKSATDTSGKTNDLKDVELTYHIFPMYYYEVAELSAEVILTKIYGESLSTSTLPMFTEKKDDAYVYKYTDEDGKEVTLYSLIKDISDKKTAVSNAGSDTDKKKEAQTALDNALAALWGKVEKCAAEGEMAKKVVEEYRTKLTDNLKETYEHDILDKVGAKVWALIDASVTLSSYPEKAVKEAKEAIFENLKYTYYTGTETVNNEKQNLRDIYKNVKEYIRQKSDYKADTYEASEALMQKEAEKQVGELIKVYTLAQAMGISTDVNKTDMQEFMYSYVASMFGYDSMDEASESMQKTIKSFAQQYLSYYDETALRRAIVFDRLMDHIMETGEGKLDFKNLTYKFEAEKTDAETDADSEG
ncbi:MAG TPA: hypothetical protein DDY70_02765 [Clostridiales bacterium]|nr:hypothetical protein [Clostridiales bacterium]